MKRWMKAVAIVVVPTAAVITWYVVDRAFIKKAPLFPLSLKKARENKAKKALASAKKKLNSLMNEGKIVSYSTKYDEGINKYYIEVGSERVTDQLIRDIPKKVNGVDVVIVQREVPIAL